MYNVDEKVLEVVGGNHNIQSYLNIQNKNHFSQIIPQVVNQYIPNTPKVHTEEDENLLKERGYVIFNNYLNDQEISDLKSYLDIQ